MALNTNNTLISDREMLTELFAKPFRAIGAGLMRLAESNARTQALRELAAVSDEELRQRGLSRAEAISMAFRHDA